MKRKNDRNREFAVIAYFFVGIFLALVAYFIYFQVIKSESFINNPYNSRLDSFAERVIRGDIVSSDGKVLATTETASDGTETRTYPMGRIYAHVVGYTDNGKAGLESSYNFELLRSHSFLPERILNEIEDEKNQGDTLVTTLNDELQQAAYNALGDQKGAVVVMEPSTGKILAMVSKPDYDPNTIATNWSSILSNDDESSVLLNRATQGLYPPGSTFKLVTALEYIRENRKTYKKYSFECVGSLTEGNYTLHCYNNNAHGEVDLTTSLAKSCNTSFANIGLTLNGHKFRKTSKELLFNKTLPGNISSSKSSFSFADDVDAEEIMATAIGQGETLVSPYHMALLMSAIDNKGVLMTPYLVDHIENSDGTTVESFTPSAYGQLMTSDEAKLLRKMMKEVVNSGTATGLASSVYTAAGKTGSAEYGTNKGDSHAWFVGYAKANSADTSDSDTDTAKADIAIAVLVEGAGSGSSVGVPIAKTVFDTYFK